MFSYALLCSMMMSGPVVESEPMIIGNNNSLVYLDTRTIEDEEGNRLVVDGRKTKNDPENGEVFFDTTHIYWFERDAHGKMYEYQRRIKAEDILWLHRLQRQENIIRRFNFQQEGPPWPHNEVLGDHHLWPINPQFQ